MMRSESETVQPYLLRKRFGLRPPPPRVVSMAVKASLAWRWRRIIMLITRSARTRSDNIIWSCTAAIASSRSLSSSFNAAFQRRKIALGERATRLDKFIGSVTASSFLQIATPRKHSPHTPRRCDVDHNRAFFIDRRSGADSEMAVRLRWSALPMRRCRLGCPSVPSEAAHRPMAVRWLHVRRIHSGRSTRVCHAAVVANWPNCPNERFDFAILPSHRGRSSIAWAMKAIHGHQRPCWPFGAPV